jgi:hypothetical protein
LKNAVGNVDEIALNNRFCGVFLEELNTKINFTILTCHNSYSYVAGEVPALDAHDRCELLGLGNKKREEIAQKWICLALHVVWRENYNRMHAPRIDHGTGVVEPSCKC